MIGADTVVKVVRPIGKSVQMDIEILKETTRIILTLDGHSKPATHPGIDAVGCDEISTADEFLLVAPIDMNDPCRDAVRIQRQILKRRVVFDGFAEPGASVVAHERFGLTLAVREDAVVSRVDRRVIEAGAHFRALAVTNKVHHVTLAPQIPFEDTPA